MKSRAPGIPMGIFFFINHKNKDPPTKRYQPGFLFEVYIRFFFLCGSTVFGEMFYVVGKICCFFVVLEGFMVNDSNSFPKWKFVSKQLMR